MDEQTTPELTEAAPEVAQHETFPAALLKEAHLLLEQAKQLEAELARLLRGFFHAKGLDPQADPIHVDLQAGTYHVAPAPASE